MRENRRRTILSKGVATGTWLARDPELASGGFVAREDWDRPTIDLQHGLVEYPSALAMLQANSQPSAVRPARAPSNEPGLIRRLLAAGADRTICSMVNHAP